MITLPPTTLPNGAKVPPLDSSNYLGAAFDGTNYVYIEQSDMLAAPLPAGITNSNNPQIAQIFNGSYTFNPSFFGIVSTQISVSGLVYGTRRLQDACNVSWDKIETSLGVYDPVALSRLDSYVADAVLNGYELIYTFKSIPAWAGAATTGIPSNAAYLADFITFLINRFGVNDWNNAVNLLSGKTLTQLNARVPASIATNPCSSNLGAVFTGSTLYI